MVEAVRPGDSTLRLVEQLNALSQLTESLAFRVVELEERLAATELKLKPLLDASGSAAHADDTELRLEDTEERIARLESLLNGAGSLGVVHSGGAGAAGMGVSEDRHPDALEDPDPFIEEGEQPFMDELVA
jgi:hypothetical protein